MHYERLNISRFSDEVKNIAIHTNTIDHQTGIWKYKKNGFKAKAKSVVSLFHIYFVIPQVEPKNSK